MPMPGHAQAQQAHLDIVQHTEGHAPEALKVGLYALPSLPLQSHARVWIWSARALAF